jgi:catechol 2,3-dioxygenase-like lactoylglutathione lyase family enzyme
MITNIAIASIYVKDIDESKAFYVDVLGFDENSDVTLSDGYRWCTVSHPNQPEIQVHLTIPGPPHTADMVAAMNRALDEGNMHALGMAVDDCHKTFEELKAQGVEFIQEPSDRPYGVEAVCRDNSGNWMVLVEQKAYAGADFPHG